MSAIVDALLSELDDQALARLAKRLAPYLEPSTEQPTLLTAAEAAALLRCKPKRIYELAQRGALPVRRDGGRVLFHRDDITAYLETHERPPAQPVRRSPQAPPRRHASAPQRRRRARGRRSRAGNCRRRVGRTHPNPQPRIARR